MAPFDDSVWTGGNASVSWDTAPPFTFEGTVVSQEQAFQTDIKTKDVLTWKDGRPRRKTIITLADKDGALWDLHIKLPSNLQRAVADALKLQRASGLREGDWLSVTYTGDGPGEKGLTPPKLYTAALSPSAGTLPTDPFVDDQADDTEPEQ